MGFKGIVRVMTKPYIVAIAGGSGSGKTYLSRALHELLGETKSCLIYQDNYYIDQSNKFDFDGGSVNFDHPESIDFDLLSKHLLTLKQGKSVQVPQYDFATHSRLEETIQYEPKEIIIIEGILILSNAKIRSIVDESIFVEAPEEIRYQRRLKRDVEERGRTEEGVYAQFYKQVKPMHDEFVEPSKKYADCITSGTCQKTFEKTLERFKKS